MEASADSWVAGYASATAEASTKHTTYTTGSVDVGIDFEGSYRASATNALGTSELELLFRVDGDGVSRDTHALTVSSFLADLNIWDDDYAEGVWAPDVPGGDFTVTMEANVLAAAIGTSTTTISAANHHAGHFNGYFSLDEYTVKKYF